MAEPARNWNDAPSGAPPVPPPPLAPLGFADTTSSPAGWAPAPARASRRWRRPALIAGVAILALLVLGLATGNIRFFVSSGSAAQGDTSGVVPQVGDVKDGVVRGSAVSFRYPKRWQVLHMSGLGDAGGATGATMLGLDGRNAVAVTTFPLSVPVISPDDFPRFRREVGQLMQQHAGTSNDRIVGGPTGRRLGGYLAIEYQLVGPGAGGSFTVQRIVVSAHGPTEVWVNCFSTRPHREAIQKGCEQILHTFAIG